MTSEKDSPDTPKTNSFKTLSRLETASGELGYFSLPALEEQGVAEVSKLPYSIKILLESLLRNENGVEVGREDVLRVAGYDATAVEAVEIPFHPSRVVLQDFTGVPSVVDLAALRSAMERMGGDPARINPSIPVDLVIDHSVQVDHFGGADSAGKNTRLEFTRNRERYEFLRWGQSAFDNFRVIPPSSGIIHQVNLEYLAEVVQQRPRDASELPLAIPDSLVGTDSHTTMINGLGVLGWGVGGIEAEAVMLGQPIYMLLPEVIGVRVTGALPPGTTATDLVLRVTERLRQEGVVEKFVEFYGPGLSAMSLPDRATLANMAPEYGATMGFFPIDDETLAYLRGTGRSDAVVDRVERYAKAQGLFRSDDSPDPVFTKTVDLDLGSIVPALAGPRRPQDRIALSDMKQTWLDTLGAPTAEGGFGVPDDSRDSSTVLADAKAGDRSLTHGSVVIAAITSCTNTSNPSVMLAAGLLAKKAVAAGLRVPGYVKTTLAPGSRAATDYLAAAGLDGPLEALGFYTVGYGCTTCIGNSGPLPTPMVEAIGEGDLIVASVLSGNRNFSGRVSPHTKANYLASPPLVVAYALAGTVNIDMARDPLGTGADGAPVFLKDVWPSEQEIEEHRGLAMAPATYRKAYDGIEDSNEAWNAIEVAEGTVFAWDDASSYIQEPPFFADMSPELREILPIEGARVLFFGEDSVTTDHISPAGVIPSDGPAAAYLRERGVEPKDFNSFGSRRGNDRVMVRGTFGNIRVQNRLAGGKEGGWTRVQSGPTASGDLVSVYDAAMTYKAQGTPLVVLAGKDYGMGSSRDWAAKGTFLLGVRAVIATTFERIHRSNLAGMGVLPLEFAPGESADTHGLDGSEAFTIHIDEALVPRQQVKVEATSANGETTRFEAVCRLDTPIEIDYYRNGGILHKVLRDMM